MWSMLGRYHGAKGSYQYMFHSPLRVTLDLLVLLDQLESKERKETEAFQDHMELQDRKENLWVLNYFIGFFFINVSLAK